MTREEQLQECINRAFGVASDVDYGMDAQTAIYRILRDYATVENTTELREAHSFSVGDRVRLTKDAALYDEDNNFKGMWEENEVFTVTATRRDAEVMYLKHIHDGFETTGLKGEIYDFELVEEKNPRHFLRGDKIKSNKVITIFDSDHRDSYGFLPGEIFTFVEDSQTHWFTQIHIAYERLPGIDLVGNTEDFDLFEERKEE